MRMAVRSEDMVPPRLGSPRLRRRGVRASGARGQKMLQGRVCMSKLPFGRVLQTRLQAQRRSSRVCTSKRNPIRLHVILLHG